MKHRIWANLLWLSVVAVFMFAHHPARADTDWIDDDASGELRQHFHDLQQEAWTTSLDWYDLAHVTRHPAVPPPAPPTPLRVVIDVGHGGKDFGAQGYYGVSEKKLCLRIAELVKADLETRHELKGRPLEIRMTRETDRYLTLHNRVRLANEWNADLFLSIHANATEDFPKARGFEVYFLSSRPTDAKARTLALVENDGQPVPELKSDVLSMLSDAQNTLHLEASESFAETVFHAMARRLKANGRGVRQGPFAVLSGTAMPAVLVEVGYVTNPDEAWLLSSPLYLKGLANAISSGIVEFAKSVRPSDVPPQAAPQPLS